MRTCQRVTVNSRFSMPRKQPVALTMDVVMHYMYAKWGTCVVYRTYRTV